MSGLGDADRPVRRFARDVIVILVERLAVARWTASTLKARLSEGAVALEVLAIEHIAFGFGGARIPAVRAAEAGALAAADIASSAR